MKTNEHKDGFAPTLPKVPIDFQRQNRGCSDPAKGMRCDSKSMFRQKRKILDDQEQDLVANEFLRIKSLTSDDIRYMIWVFDKTRVLTDEEVEKVEVLSYIWNKRKVLIDFWIDELKLCSQFKIVMELRNDKRRKRNGVSATRSNVE